MNEYILAISGPIFPLCVVAAWGIIYIVVYKCLGQISLFKGRSAMPVALCVSVLAIIGMFQPFLDSQEDARLFDKRGHDGIMLEILLWIYGALGIAILLSAIFFFVNRVCRGKKPRKFPQKIERRMESLSPFRYWRRL